MEASVSTYPKLVPQSTSLVGAEKHSRVSPPVSNERFAPWKTVEKEV